VLFVGLVVLIGCLIHKYARRKPQTTPNIIDLHGQSMNYGQPAYGQPMYGQPMYGQPIYGQPNNGNLNYAQPMPMYG
jgi:hypothetical protein